MSFLTKSLKETTDFTVSPEDWQQEGNSTEARLSIPRMKSKDKEQREKCWYIDLYYMVKEVVKEDTQWKIKDKELRKMRFFGRDPVSAKATFEKYVADKKRDISNELIKQQKTQQAQLAVQKAEAAAKVTAAVQPPTATNMTEALQTTPAQQGGDFTFALLHPAESLKQTVKPPTQTRKVNSKPKGWTNENQRKYEKAETRLSSALTSANPLLLKKSANKTMKRVPPVSKPSNTLKRVSGLSYKAVSPNPFKKALQREKEQNAKINQQIRSLFE